MLTEICSHIQQDKEKNKKKIFKWHPTESAKYIKQVNMNKIFQKINKTFFTGKINT